MTSADSLYRAQSTSFDSDSDYKGRYLKLFEEQTKNSRIGTAVFPQEDRKETVSFRPVLEDISESYFEEYQPRETKDTSIGKELQRMNEEHHRMMRMMHEEQGHSVLKMGDLEKQIKSSSVDDYLTAYTASLIQKTSLQQLKVGTQKTSPSSNNQWDQKIINKPGKHGQTTPEKWSGISNIPPLIKQSSEVKIASEVQAKIFEGSGEEVRANRNHSEDSERSMVQTYYEKLYKEHFPNSPTLNDQDERVDLDLDQTEDPIRMGKEMEVGAKLKGRGSEKVEVRNEDNKMEQKGDSKRSSRNSNEPQVEVRRQAKEIITPAPQPIDDNIRISSSRVQAIRNQQLKPKKVTIEVQQPLFEANTLHPHPNTQRMTSTIKTPAQLIQTINQQTQTIPRLISPTYRPSSNLHSPTLSKSRLVSTNRRSFGLPHHNKRGTSPPVMAMVPPSAHIRANTGNNEYYTLANEFLSNNVFQQGDYRRFERIPSNNRIASPVTLSRSRTRPIVNLRPSSSAPRLLSPRATLQYPLPPMSHNIFPNPRIEAPIRGPAENIYHPPFFNSPVSYQYSTTLNTPRCASPRSISANRYRPVSIQSRPSRLLTNQPSSRPFSPAQIQLLPPSSHKPPPHPTKPRKKLEAGITVTMNHKR